MTGPGQPRTCSHPINTRTLTGVCQAVRTFSSYLSYSSLCKARVFGPDFWPMTKLKVVIYTDSFIQQEVKSMSFVEVFCCTVKQLQLYGQKKDTYCSYHL